MPVQLDATAPLTLTTDANGEFSAALPDGFYSLTVSATGYLSQTVGVTVTTGLTTTADIALRLYAPCQNVAPAALSASLPPGQIVTRTLAISNTGAADLAWELEERIPPSQVPAVVGGNTARARPVATPRQASRASIVPLADVVLDGSFEATAGGTYENPYWQQGSTNYGTVLCTLDSPPNGCGSGAGTVGPHSGSWFVWFGGIEPSFPTEHGYVSQDVLLQPGIGTLSFWLRIGASSGRADDTMRVLIDNTEIFSVTAQSTEYSNYQQVTLPISSFADGLTHTLRL
ncbi:MAG TPA: carboxypeptidase-like regulatory domain-containing protein, partial [Roseiflexaceae bacterium]|nr:carboxypeptidase-like regulatory domain-containing protein [Roseiflexaceae bacterium]